MKLAFREFGSGQPLIILHGLFGQSDNWNTLAKNFGEKGFHVFTLDQRNHGLSPHSDEWNYEVMATDLKEFIDDHQLHNPILLGHSMGGKTVLFFELKYSGIAQKLIIVDIAARAYEPHHNDVLKALHAVDFNTITTRKEADVLMNTYLTDFRTKQFLLKNIYWKDSVKTKEFKETKTFDGAKKIEEVKTDNKKQEVELQDNKTNDKRTEDKEDSLSALKIAEKFALCIT